MLLKRYIDNAKVRRIAHILLRHPHVQAVELFGSVAREGAGRDLDLIVITDEDRALDFVGLCLGESAFCSGLNMASRRYAAIESLDWGGLQKLNFLLSTAELLARPTKIDIFVFPPNWREMLGFLQVVLPHKDRNFMENIARDALLIASKSAR